MILSAIKVFLPAVLSFIVGLAITPSLSDIFYKKKMWKSRSRSAENKDYVTPEFKQIHHHQAEVSTPRIGGVIIWLSVLITILLVSLNSFIVPSNFNIKLNFLSKNQTLLPLFTLIFASIIGLVDDFIQIYSKRSELSDGLTRKLRILVVMLIGAVGAWWFFFKLETLSIHIPFDGDINLGLLFIPFFILVVLGVFSGSVIDGLDGLAGGVLASSFGAYLLIAFSHNQIDLAAFCAVIVGGILAFLWFNIPPARFYMGETGMMGLTVTLAVIAFLTNAVLVLPIIAFPLFITSLSVIIQRVGKRFNKRVFKVAPLHHHFEAAGWPHYKVTMRFWIISIVFALLGTVIALIG
jgi:phospho-N-acetylmuramoyl-pentapeptide-transferase